MYRDLTKILKDGKCGAFELSHFEVKSDDLYALLHDIPCGKFVRLLHNGQVVMSNTEMEKQTNIEFVQAAHGDVLIGGLGIGMILLAIQDKPEVNSITVLEKYREVIELVGNQLPINNKIQIVEADVFDYIAESQYDTIYIDIWDCINKDIYRNQMVPLLKKYEKFLISKEVNSNRWIDCWCRSQAKYEIRI